MGNALKLGEMVDCFFVSAQWSVDVVVTNAYLVLDLIHILFAVLFYFICLPQLQIIFFPVYFFVFVKTSKKKSPI